MAWMNNGFQLFADRFGEKELVERINFEHTKSSESPEHESLFALSTFMNGFPPFIDPVGTGGLGEIKIVDDPKFPDHEFFSAGRKFKARLQHSNLLQKDDAGSAIRLLSIKFSEYDDEGLLDILMSTGQASIFWNTSSFNDFIKVTRGDITGKEYVYKNPYYFKNLLESLRKAPDSYAELSYYAQCTMLFKANDGKVRYCRYRAIPGDMHKEKQWESGILSNEEQKSPWILSRDVQEARPEDYLCKEYLERLNNKPINYRLQIQIHDKSSEDTSNIFHAGILWNKDVHPWLDLATVTVKTPLSREALQRTSFNPLKQPRSLGLLKDQLPEEYRKLTIFSNNGKHHSENLHTGIHSNRNAVYTIDIKTGDRENAGTDSTISIRFSGSKGRTNYVRLNKRLHNDFERGQNDTYRITAFDVGEIYCVELSANVGWKFVHRNPDWFVDKIKITINSSQNCFTSFPYQWIYDHLVLFREEATLPFNEMPAIMAEHRRKELKKRKEIYQWYWIRDNLPGCVKAATYSDLPRNSRFSDEKLRSYHARRKGTPVNLSYCENWNSYSDYNILYDHWSSHPTMAKRWHQDRWFAYQFLNGVNPVLITRCDSLPENFPVSYDLVKASLDRGESLEKELNDGHIYIVDYEILVGCKTYGGPVLDDFGYQAPDHLKHDKADVRYCAAPIALFYVNKEGHLMPIAIQINQEPGPENPIWTPHEPNPYDWMLAKLWLRVAESNFHQLCTHLLRTHLTTEPFALSTWRNLSSAHPIFKLLQPHIYGVLAIDTIGRKELIGKGGIVDLSLSLGGGGHVTFMEKCFKQTSFQDYNLPKNLKKRGVDDPSKLPEYYYRDDGLALWEAIEKFVSEIVGIFYKSDDDVKKDDEIQNWILDVYKNGWRETLGNPTHDLLAKFESREQLVELLTCLIFTFSCQHAAVNFSQKDHYGFTPNAPAIMRKPPPSKKGEATLKSILSTLPNKSQAVKAIATVYILTKFSEDERFLGNYSCTAWEDLEALGAISQFQNNLEIISEKIKKRNTALEIPYIYLLPERVPNGTAI